MAAKAATHDKHLSPLGRGRFARGRNPTIPQRIYQNLWRWVSAAPRGLISEAETRPLPNLRFIALFRTLSSVITALKQHDKRCSRSPAGNASGKCFAQPTPHLPSRPAAPALARRGEQRRGTRCCADPGSRPMICGTSVASSRPTRPRIYAPRLRLCSVRGCKLRELRATFTSSYRGPRPHLYPGCFASALNAAIAASSGITV